MIDRLFLAQRPMSGFLTIVFTFVILLAGCALPPTIPTLHVEDMGTCKEVVDGTPINRTERFRSKDSRICVFIRVSLSPEVENLSTPGIPILLVSKTYYEGELLSEHNWSVKKVGAYYFGYWCLTAPEDQGFPVGKYMIEFWFGDWKLGTTRFEVE